MNQAQTDELIRLLEQYELSIAALYDTFASNLPEYKQFWGAFAEEERQHARWIGKLYAHLKNQGAAMEQTRFTIQSTRTAIEYIERQTAQAMQQKPDLKQSLITAVNIEQALLESAFFKVFNLGNPKALTIRTRLEDATKAHIQRLIEWRDRACQA
jgi:rubrerythrin